MLILLLLQSAIPTQPVVRTTKMVVRARVEQHCRVSREAIVCRGARDGVSRRAPRLQNGVVLAEF